MVAETFFLWAQQLIIQFSYLAVFLVSIVSTSTIFIPLPLYLVIFFASGLGLNPFLVGVISGLGSAVGELVGYLVGVGGRSMIERKKRTPKIVKSLTKLFDKYGFWVILLTAFLPFPFDFIGILSGVSHYDIKKFYLAVAIGKSIKTTLIAYAGHISLPYLMFLITSI